MTFFVAMTALVRKASEGPKLKAASFETAFIR